MVRTSVCAQSCSSPNKYSCTKAGKGKRRGTLGREKEGGRRRGAVGVHLTLCTTYAALTRYKHLRETLILNW